MAQIAEIERKKKKFTDQDPSSSEERWIILFLEESESLLNSVAEHDIVTPD